MSPRFTGKVILITGATAGMGLATAQRIAAEGGTVVLSARDKRRGEDSAQQIRDTGGRAMFVPADVTVEDDMATLVRTTVEEFGRLDGAFNNAGGGNTFGSIRTMDSSSWHATLDLNLHSLFYSLRYEVPAILASGGGAIVNNASAQGVIGNAQMPAYNAAKHGVVGLTRSAALELARDNVRVNALITGVIDTPLYRAGITANPELETYLGGLIPAGRVGGMDDVAAFTAFLLSDEATYITGAALAIDGGVTTA